MSVPSVSFPEWNTTVSCCIEGVVIARIAFVLILIVAFALFVPFVVIVWGTKALHFNIRVMLLQSVSLDIIVTLLWSFELTNWTGKVRNPIPFDYLRASGFFMESFTVLGLLVERFVAHVFFKTYEQNWRRFRIVPAAALIVEIVFCVLIIFCREIGWATQSQTSYVTITACVISLPGALALSFYSRWSAKNESHSRFNALRENGLSSRFQMAQNVETSRMMNYLNPIAAVTLLAMVGAMLWTAFNKSLFPAQYFVLWSWYLCVVPFRAILTMAISVTLNPRLRMKVTVLFSKMFAGLRQGTGDRRDVENRKFTDIGETPSEETEKHFNQLSSAWGSPPTTVTAGLPPPNATLSSAPETSQPSTITARIDHESTPRLAVAAPTARLASQTSDSKKAENSRASIVLVRQKAEVSSIKERKIADFPVVA